MNEVGRSVACLSPPGTGVWVVLIDVRSARSINRQSSSAPKNTRPKEHASQGLDAFRLLQEETLDHHRICEQSVVLLCSMLFFLDRQDVPGTVGEGPRRRHMGAQHDAAGLFRL